MDGTRKTQEQFSGMDMDGRYTENAGAVFRDVHAGSQSANIIDSETHAANSATIDPGLW